ncbi:MAG TPA: RIP metalloprotease RseP [Gemmatimonadaceae bacterium]|nr:RIP metalloprotease RseP [Gemmatimonadaceae bacterium]
MLSWLAPILVFGLVVLVHELGHFMAAKWLGVYAPRFSIGFGPALWRRRFGETEYVIGALPLGGFVRMASREDEATAFLEGGSEESKVPAVGASSSPTVTGEPHAVEAKTRDWDPDAMVPFGPKPVPENRWFESKPLWGRLIIMLAGVTMNAILALVVSTGLFAGYGRAYIPAVVDSVVPGRPAERGGLQRGDSIIAVDGTPVRRWDEVTRRISTSAGQELALDVVRGGRTVTVRVTPELRSDTTDIGTLAEVGRIGAGATRTLARESMSIGESAVAGWHATWNMGTSVIRVVGGLISGEVSMSQLGGPITIGRVSVEAAKSGLEALWSLIAFLSINVAVLNLLPIPILDGGQILLNLAEGAKGSAFSARTREYIMRAGLLAIALLFALVMFNDVKGLIGLFQ